MDDTECLICLEDLDNYSIVQLSCNHRYHYNCLKSWIKQKKNKYKICTICNDDVEIITIYNENIKETDNILIETNESSSIDNRQSNNIRSIRCCTIL